MLRRFDSVQSGDTKLFNFVEQANKGVKMKLPVNYDNLTPKEKQEVREEYVRLQKGKCYHCGNPLYGPPHETARNRKVKPKLYPKGFFNNPVHLHHNHNTGMTLGAVHCHCNAVLWEYYGE